MGVNIRDYDYHLPPELIAQTPIEPRDSSRLLVVERASGELAHRYFRDIGAYLRPADLLIANQSRVIPARLLGRRLESGGAVEVLLLAARADLGANYWETLVRPGRRLREGARVAFGAEGSSPCLQAEVLQRTEAGGRLVRFFSEPARDETVSTATISRLIEHAGRMPLPPYIHETLSNPERYQTVYA
nr:S-adenosylmethionine:tRNA ribosyltransferase-isomerase [Chloroflexota bacterium]